jgi:hypothetical protein
MFRDTLNEKKLTKKTLDLVPVEATLLKESETI